mgnify:CR=1 FL=1|jgi:hypothetical protein
MNQKRKNRRAFLGYALFTGACIASPFAMNYAKNPDKNIEEKLNPNKDTIVTFKHGGYFGTSFLEKESTILVKPYTIKQGERVDPLSMKLKDESVMKYGNDYVINNTINRSDLERNLFEQLNSTLVKKNGNIDYSKIQIGTDLYFPIELQKK